jgi:hypothetical protein
VKISDTEQSLRSVYSDWSGFLLNPRFARLRSSVAWIGFAPRILDDPIMASDVAMLIDAGQYSYQFFDGSIMQLHYLFDRRGDELRAANLAYYSAKTIFQVPTVQVEQITDTSSQVEAAFEHGDVDQQLGVDDPSIAPQSVAGDNSDDSPVNPELSSVDDPETDMYLAPPDGPASWLRIDYAPRDAKGVLHYECHMHLSMFYNSRLVVDGVPTPRQFVEFIIALCYPDIYREHRLDDNGEYPDETFMHSVNSPCLPGIENNVCRHIAHLKVPNVMGAHRPRVP